MSLSIGERLKSAREAKGLTLEQTHRVTKVQLNLLEGIESNRIDELLDPAYAKIFLRKYASFLGLDGAALVEEYLAHRGPLPQRPIALKTEAQESQRRESFQRYLFPTAALVTAGIGLAFLGYLAFDLYGTLKDKGLSTSRSEGMKGASKTSEPKLLVPRGQPLKLTILARENVWMQVKSDGAVIFQNVLTKGSRESWTAQEDLELWTGNAGATELILNGHSLGSPGTGVKKGIRVTREGIKGQP